ncbi:deleted in malignant brain tumors 1 protein-like isoform X4 [Bolinopsis microptera]|uniref:deleted in malignant brain tumors 1 protein-like isoform X4 n=1 Tax=Bolinopsis microptera TaxID=2820187 RepID=UPI003079F333
MKTRQWIFLFAFFVTAVKSQEVEDSSLFRLVTDSGENVSPGERGLLLYKGGTVCYDKFSDHSANAICRVLGYSRASNWTSGYHFNLIHQLGLINQLGFDITMFDVECGDDDWESCSYSTSEFCYHYRVFLSCAAEEPVDANLFRLVTNSGEAVSPGERGLLLYKGGTVCKDKFSDHSANAICRLLGYTRAINWESGYLWLKVQTGLDITLDDVECSEGDWGSCWFTTSHNCYHDKDVHMSCYTAEEVEDSSLFRLVTDSDEDVSPGERGLLLYKGGTVCNDKFSDHSANAICRVLGHSRASNWTSGYHYNLIHQLGFDITLFDVECGDDDWESCSYSTSEFCYHYRDVFLSCAAEEPVDANLFRLVTNSGEAVSPGERGLLLYKGGTVCKDKFSDHSANAICRLLGYTRAINWESGYLWYKVQMGLDITLDDVECSEGDWGSCWFSTSHNCYHDKDVHMSCYTAAEEVEQDLFRLVTESGEDVVEQERGLLLYKNGTVCHDRFNENSANAICKELGYSRSLNWTSGYHYNFNFQLGFNITLDDVECGDDDWGLCSYSTSNDCYHLKDVFISCTSDVTAEEDSNPFRLLNELGEEASPGDWGLLFYNGGTVCKDYFSANSAHAICKEMGYDSAINWSSGYYYGFDYQRGFNITLDNVECSEADWGSCWFSTSHNCYHGDDVFMACDPAGST